ncbi:MAG: nucleotidyltransferase domain-containing protein [Candidatus Woesearchaeota archaeon]|jgi:predicted nucleotidyltransferase
MIHESNFEILNQFLGDYNREIYGRELIGKVAISQKGIALALDGLEKEGILTSKKRGTMKFFRLNLQYVFIKDVLLISEVTRKMLFFEKQKVLANLFKDDERIVGLFGSYAIDAQKKESDIDIFIIGDKKDKKDGDYSRLGKVYDLNISVKYFTIKEFNNLLNKKNNLLKEIVEKHILFFNAERFINLVWRNYYGFN